jgi:ribose transport system ATP-binding protein
MTSVDAPAPAAEIGPETSIETVVALAGITKSFGPTLANADIDLAVRRGEVVGLVGGNGAGKSTLMRILCGVIPPTLGTVAIGGEPQAAYDAAAAQRHGIRMVHQELSLCTNLSVAENFFLEAPEGVRVLPGWRRRYRERARAALDDVFPGNGIDVDSPIGQLSIGDRQIVEISRAAATPGVRLIILDEPTSSLGLERSRQLRAYIHARAQTGTAFIFISHKLHEVIDIADSVAVLRNGRLVWRGAAAEASIERLVQFMGGEGRAEGAASDRRHAADGDAVVRIAGALGNGSDEVTLRRGEIVGLAGLEGSGQQKMLHDIFSGRVAGVERLADASFVAGDRQKEGIFPLWSVLGNISIGRIARRFGLGRVSRQAENAAAVESAARLRLDPERMESGIIELSGGNQQKALVARALVADARSSCSTIPPAASMSPPNAISTS